MNKAIELAREAGFDLVNGKVYTWAGQHNVTEELKKFYTLARADLEAKNAKLRDVFGELLTNIDHATSCGAWNVQAGSQTHETIEAARAVLGEKHD